MKETNLEKIKTAELLSEISNRGFISTKRDLVNGQNLQVSKKVQAIQDWRCE